MTASIFDGFQKKCCGLLGLSWLPAAAANLVDQLVLRMERNEFGLPAYPTRLLVNGTWVPGPSCPIAPHPEIKEQQ